MEIILALLKERAATSAIWVGASALVATTIAHFLGRTVSICRANKGDGKMRIYCDRGSGANSAEVIGAYRNVVAALGKPEFDASLDFAIRRLTAAQRWYCYRDQRRTTTMIAYRNEGGLEPSMMEYRSSFVKQDPIYSILSQVNCADAAVAVAVAPRDIANERYRRNAMEDYSIGQRVSIVCGTFDAYWILNVSRSAESGDIADKSVSDLIAFVPLIFPLLSRHQQLSTSEEDAKGSDIGRIEALVGARFPSLSRREVQVCSRTILGRSSKTIARDLSIGIESVATYRKRAYQRVGISSIDALSRAVISN